jgi:hypothetical protein
VMEGSVIARSSAPRKYRINNLISTLESCCRESRPTLGEQRQKCAETKITNPSMGADLLSEAAWTGKGTWLWLG